MQTTFSKEFGTYFLLAFTKELIKNSGSAEVLKLSLVVNQEEEKIKKDITQGKKEIKNFIKQKIRKEENYILSTKKENEENFSYEKNPYRFNVPLREMNKNVPVRRRLIIPESSLPQRLQYLKPSPVREDIDLGQLNSLIQDPLVNIIECNGPDKEIIVGGTMGTRETNLKLKKEEIEGVIKTFSEKTKIPLEEGFFKVAFGRLILSAMHSETIGSKFIIKKMLYNSQNPPSMLNPQKTNFSGETKQ